jgi:bacterioferritin (cytochrome b1)
MGFHISDMPNHGETLLQILRSSLRGKMDALHKLTAQSTKYRKHAAALAREADAMSDLEEQIELMRRALQWIALAENEELIAESASRSTIVDFPPKK